MTGMKQLLLVFAVVALVGCGESAEEKAAKAKAEVKTTAEKERSEKSLIADPIVEKAIRKELEKPTGELTKADLIKVTFVVFEFTKLTDAGLKEVSKLQKLEKLSLPKQITDEGLKEVAQLQKLTYLHLTDTKISDAGLKELAKLKKLKFLSLVNTQVTDAGVAELRKALPKCDIYH
jgi:hypothetical protein